MVIGTLLIKHKTNLSDYEMIEAIHENPYMQYMLVQKEFTDKAVFDPSLFVTIRKRLGYSDFNGMSESLFKLQIERHEGQVRQQHIKNSSDSENNNDGNSPHPGSGSSDIWFAEPTSSSSSDADTSQKGVLKIDADSS